MADGVVFVFDVTDEDSFENVTSWINDVNDVGGIGAAPTTTSTASSKKTQGNNVVKLLVAAKCDLTVERVVTSDDALAFAKANNMEYVETSSASGVNVETTFVEMAHMLVKSGRIGQRRSGGTGSIELDSSPPNNRRRRGRNGSYNSDTWSDAFGGSCCN